MTKTTHGLFFAPVSPIQKWKSQSRKNLFEKMSPPPDHVHNPQDGKDLSRTETGQIEQQNWKAVIQDSVEECNEDDANEM